MQIIFRNVKTSQELIMPVTPPDFAVEEGRSVETLDMTDTGQVNLPGLRKLFNQRMEFLLPSSERNYTTGGWTGEPYAVADRLTAVLGSITTPEGDVVHATSCEWTITGGVLHVLVTYDHFVRVPQEHIMMETLKIEQEG